MANALKRWDGTQWITVLDMDTPTADARYINATGDTMTGALTVKPSGNPASINVANTNETPYISFYDSTLTTRFGYVQASAVAMRMTNEGSPSTLFRIGTIDIARVDATGVFVTGGTDLVNGGSVSSGKRQRIHCPSATGNTVYYDFDGDTANAGALLFRQNTTNCFQISSTIQAFQDIWTNPGIMRAWTSGGGGLLQLCANGASPNAYV